MAGSMSPKQAWDKFVGKDVTVADFLGRINSSGGGIERAIGDYLAGQGLAGPNSAEACRLIAEYISQTDQPAA